MEIHASHLVTLVVIRTSNGRVWKCGGNRGEYTVSETFGIDKRFAGFYGGHGGHLHSCGMLFIGAENKSAPDGDPDPITELLVINPGPHNAKRILVHTKLENSFAGF